MDGQKVAFAATGDRDSIRESMNRVLAAPGFGSERRGQLLRYLVEQTLAGREADLSEYAIAQDVLRRPNSFDPRLDSTVRSEMSRLRRALSNYYTDGGTTDSWRFEFPNRGYVPAFVKQPQEPVEVAPAQPGPVPRPKGKTAWVATAAALVVMVAALIIWRMAATPQIHSVVVLPFVNLTGDPGNEYISDGMTEGLTDSLAHIASLRVVARTSAFQFKSTNKDIREIGKQVHADAVVEGSLRRVGDGLRVTVQLNRAADGFHMLSRAFDGTAANLARMERDVTLPVVAAIRPGTQTPSGHAPDPEAYDLVLKARALRGQPSAEGFTKIVEHLKRAVALDPQYADAWAALARAYVGGAINTIIDPAAAAPQAEIAVSTALALDPQSAVAFDAMGYCNAMLLLRWKEGEEQLRNAVRLMPQDATIRQHLGLVLMAQGRLAEAIPEMSTAADLDPLSPATGASLGIVYFFARRYDQALSQWQTVLAHHPELTVLHDYLGEALVAKGQYDKGMAEYRASLAPYHLETSTLLIHALALTGRRQEALAQLAKVETPDYPDPNDMAAIYSALGDRDRAFAWLEKALIKRKVYVLKAHPFLDPLRSDPRFASLLKRAGFTP
jgi:TolB-like protein/Tfp pilus assembly protein PilF